MSFAELTSTILVTECRGICMTGYLDIVPSLYNIDAIEHVKKSLLFDRHGQVVIGHIHQDVGCLLIRCSYSKVVDLMFEDHALVGNDAQVQTGFVDSWS